MVDRWSALSSAVVVRLDALNDRIDTDPMRCLGLLDGGDRDPDGRA